MSDADLRCIAADGLRRVSALFDRRPFGKERLLLRYASLRYGKRSAGSKFLRYAARMASI